MAFNNQGQPNERIILMGGPGAGKTSAYLQIADMARKTKSDSHFYVIDIDYAVDRMLMGYPKLREWPNFHFEEAMSYDEIKAVAKKYRAKVKKGDWLITDLASKFWEITQDEYTFRVYGEDKADYFLAKRAEIEKAAKKPKNDNAFEGWTDWPVIKEMYYNVMNDLTFTRGHSLFTAGPKPVNRATDDKGIVADFGHIGFRPEGEKRFAHNVHTVVMLEQKKTDVYLMSTGKDREREQMTKEPIKNFAMDYLVKRAGWSLT